MDIVHHILHHAVQNRQISQKDELESYFENISADVEDWPFFDEENQTNINYLQAKVGTDRFGFSSELNLDVQVDGKNAQYIISERIALDSKIEVEIDSVFKNNQKAQLKDNYVYQLIQKHKQFLKNILEKNKDSITDALIKIHAHSGEVNGIKTRGGYVWATYGFDFQDPYQLSLAKNEFQKFANEHGVEIAPKDLKYFCHPCHFAAFRTAKKVGGEELGKAFLLQHEWFGKLSAPSKKKKDEMRDYARLYHTKGKEAAEKVLSKSFLAVLNKYNHQKSSFGLFQKLFQAKKAIKR